MRRVLAEKERELEMMGDDDDDDDDDDFGDDDHRGHDHDHEGDDGAEQEEEEAGQGQRQGREQIEGQAVDVDADVDLEDGEGIGGEAENVMVHTRELEEMRKEIEAVEDMGRARVRRVRGGHVGEEVDSGDGGDETAGRVGAGGVMNGTNERFSRRLKKGIAAEASGVKSVH